MVGDLVEPLADRLVDEMVESDRHVRQMVEQRLQPVGEERQPVLHADIAAAFADRMIEQVVPLGGAELGDIALAEAGDALGRQRPSR